MASADPGDGMVPLERAELVTQDMDLIAELIRNLYTEHEAAFSCPDPGLVDGRVRSVTAGGLNASLIRYGGFTYSAEAEPANSPLAVVCTGNSGFIATAREDLHLARGDVFMTPADLPAVTFVHPGDYAALRVPWAAVGSAAEAATGMPAADLRFETMAPVSADRQRMFARTAELICGQLVTSGATEIYPLVRQELTRLAAVAFLVTFPNITMTVPYLPGPGWVALERAHAELGDADPAAGITVGAVGRRWGWASPSQFTAAYQRRFGVLPSHTLRS